MTESEAREILAQEMEKSAPKVYMTLVHNLRHSAFKLGEDTAWPATIAAMQRAYESGRYDQRQYENEITGTS
jgi:hypothetical protein